MNMKFNPECVKPHACSECDDKCVNKTFLSGLPEPYQQDLIGRSVHKTMRKGDYVFREGDKVDSIVLIKKGQVKLNNYEADGRENIIGIFSDNDTIWEGVFSDNSRYPYSAVCLCKTNCCYIRLRDIESAMSTPAVALKVINMLSNKLHDANERNRILSISEPMKRVAAFLIFREQRSSAPYITLRLDDIAGSVGLRPETVSRYIRRMVNEGYIEKIGQSGIRIPDFEKLNTLVNE